MSKPEQQGWTIPGGYWENWSQKLQSNKSVCGASINMMATSTRQVSVCCGAPTQVSVGADASSVTSNQNSTNMTQRSKVHHEQGQAAPDEGGGPELVHGGDREELQAAPDEELRQRIQEAGRFLTAFVSALTLQT